MKVELLTVQQAAQLRNVSRNAVYKAVTDGRLPCRRVLGHIGLRKTDVLAWDCKNGRRRRQPMSAESRGKLSESQKQRWAKRKAESSS